MSAGFPPDKRFNLSSWTLRHQALVIFLIVLVTLFGALSYGKLAQSEDPPFTFKVMVIRTLWPGATARQVQEEVAYTSTAFPMLSGTLVTVSGFLPIALAQSAPGEYTRSIFEVSAIALLLSWLAAVIVIPLLGSWILSEHPRRRGSGSHQAPA